MGWLAVAVAVAVVIMVVVLSRRRDVVEEPWRDDTDLRGVFGRRSRAAAPPSSTAGSARGSVPFSPDPDYASIPRSEYLSPAAEARRLRVVDGMPNVGLRRERGQLVLALLDEGGAAGRALIDPESAALQGLGLHVFRPRGLSLHEPAIEAAALHPPAPVVLRREPADPDFPDAIDVCSAEPGEALLGSVDRAHAAVLAPLMDAGEELSAITLSGPRAGRFGTPVAVLAARSSVLDALLLTLR
ncbi:HIRAN domain-containing protein [Schaalia naturae]|uniref:HIRAN domain-containing protein n=1 Tax=Schaalia naturae TaxID=635203 RepID=A0ABW2SNT3_9ACTO